jgi:hypothetical protein
LTSLAGAPKHRARYFNLRQIEQDLDVKVAGVFTARIYYAVIGYG